MAGGAVADSQVREFRERGYVVVRGLVSAAELEPMLVSYLAAARGERIVPGWNDRLEPGRIVQLGDPSAKLGWRDMPYFERICAIARALGGDDMVLAYDQMIYKQPGQETEVLWHQDAGYHWQGSASERGITCWLALVDVTRDQGTMTFLPGSHRHGIVPHHTAQDRNPIGGALEAEADTGAAEQVEYRAGDCSFHHGRTLHYTGANRTDRPRASLSSHFWPLDSARRDAPENGPPPMRTPRDPVVDKRRRVVGYYSLRRRRSVRSRRQPFFKGASMRNRISLRTLGLLLGGLALAAVNVSAGGEEEAAATGPITIGLLNAKGMAWANNEDLMASQAEEYNRIHGTEITVESSLVPFESLHEKALTDFVSGTGSFDMISVLGDWLAEFIRGEFLEPLDAYLEAKPPDGYPEQFPPALMWMQTGPDGKVYGLPFHDGPIMFYYRKDLIADPANQAAYKDRYGYDLDVPRTWASSATTPSSSPPRTTTAPSSAPSRAASSFPTTS